jgi:hypothetical protein
MKMGKIKKGVLSFCACLLFGSLTTNAFGEDIFDPVKVIYLKNGEPMRCQIGVIEGTRAVCRNFGGSASVPLRIIDLEKTFPKFKRREGETIILVHPGQVYRDENIILSNLRMVREDEGGPTYDHPGSRSPSNLQPSHYVIFFDVMNRGDSCEVRATVAFRDKQGNVFHQIDVPSEFRVPARGMAFLKKQLEFTRNRVCGKKEYLVKIRGTKLSCRHETESCPAEGGKNKSLDRAFPQRKASAGSGINPER